MNFFLIILIYIVSFGFTWLFLKIFTLNVSKRLISQPNERSSHEKPTPQGGGLSFLIIGSIFAIYFGNLKLMYGCIPLGIVGFCDDFYKLNPWTRYFVQILSVFYYLIIYKFDFFNYDFNSQLFSSFLFILILIFFTGFINFINFMDGIDGIVALNLAIFLLVASIDVSTSIFPIFTSLIGFLIWNWSPAKIFMGDVGSTFLGALAVGIIIQKDSLIEFIFLTLILSPLLIDAFVCVIRRFISSENIFKAHKLHLYQRLYQAGWSHSKISLIYGFFSLILAVLYLIKSYKIFLIITCFELLYGIYLDKIVAVPFKTSNK